MGDGACPPWPLSSSQVRSERPLFSSNPELDNLVSPEPPTVLPSVLPSVASGLVGRAGRRPPDTRPQVAIAAAHRQSSAASSLGTQIRCSEFKSESCRILQGCGEDSVR